MPNIKSMDYRFAQGVLVVASMWPHDETCIMPAILVHAFFEGKLVEVLKQIEEDKKKWQISNQ